jgi:hypothetical protein
MSITVIDVMREERVDITPSLSWAVGEETRDLWFSIHGELPPKELREKTNGKGTHCFAVYPDAMRPHIVRIIRKHQTEPARQGELFGVPA